MDLRFLLNGSPDIRTRSTTASSAHRSRPQPRATAPSPNRSTPRAALASSPTSSRPSPRVRDHQSGPANKTPIRNQDSRPTAIIGTSSGAGPSGAPIPNDQTSSKDVDIPPPIVKVDEHGIKTFHCTTCHSGFTAKGHCTVHVRTVHLGLIGAICPICKAKFPQKGSCQRHINNVHLKMKRYSCPDQRCRRRFAEHWSAKCHYETVHLKIKTHSCRVGSCSKIFSEKWNRKKHERAVHKVIFDDDDMPIGRLNMQASTASPAGPSVTVPPKESSSSRRLPRTSNASNKTPAPHRSRSGRERIPPLEPFTPVANLTRSRSGGNVSPRLPTFGLGMRSNRASRVNNTNPTDAIDENTPAGVAALLLMSRGDWNRKSTPRAHKEHKGDVGNSSRRDASRRSKSVGPLRSKSRKLTEKKSTTRGTHADETDSEISASSRHSRLRKGHKKRD